MKSHFFLCLLLGLLGTGLSAQSPLKLGSDPWPPFTGAPGQPRVVIDLVEAALERAGSPGEIRMVPTGELSGKLQSGELQGSPALWKTAEREKTLLYSHPILENRLLLVGRTDSDVSFSSLRELTGKKVGIIAGYGYGPEINQHAIEWVPGKNHQENLIRLMAGKVDYILVNELQIQYAIQHQREALESHIRYGNSPLLRRSLHFVLRKDTPGAQEIIAAFNRELKNMIQDGSYQKLLQLPWLEMDTDGDGEAELVYRGSQAGSALPQRRYQPFLMESEEVPDVEYHINGKHYPSWEDVPSSLKERPDSEAKGVLYEFSF